MKFRTILFLSVSLPILAFVAQAEKPAVNRQINFNAFLADAVKVESHRAQRRVSVEEFVRLANTSGTIVLDTRSKAAFDRKHIKGARHLNFSDITKDSLAKVIPNPETRILIYCNNNFTNNSPAFASKAPAAALNIPTFVTLFTYGYRNVYELGPEVDELNTILEFEGTDG